jgi:hypothetical protein
MACHGAAVALKPATRIYDYQTMPLALDMYTTKNIFLSFCSATVASFCVSALLSIRDELSRCITRTQLSTALHAAALGSFLEETDSCQAHETVNRKHSQSDPTGSDLLP